MRYLQQTILIIILFGSFTSANAQKVPSLIIDSTEIQFSEVSMPYWLKAGQKIGLGVNAKTVSVLEFTINGTALDFSRVLSITSNQTVPTNKAWKIEGIGLNKSDTTNTLGTIFLSGGSTSSSSSSNLPVIFQSPKKFETPGTYTWNVPPGVTSICIEVWGGGGAGNSSNYGYAGGGGGGGYGYACFKVTPGTQYTVIVGEAGLKNVNLGAGGSSSVGNLISATGGGGGAGNSGWLPSGTTGGAGGTSSAAYNITGENGGNAGFSAGGKGGNGANGGVGGNGASGVTAGTGAVVGGGGGGTGSSSSSIPNPGSGARGQVYIYF